MPKRPEVLTGTAGVYYVAYQLAARGFHAAVTHGNAPSVDILVSAPDGGATLSLQVKSATWAKRFKGRGETKTLDHYEWAVGWHWARTIKPDVVFALVDLKSQSSEMPDVFLVRGDVIRKNLEDYVARSGKRTWRYGSSVSDLNKVDMGWDGLAHMLGMKTT